MEFFRIPIVLAALLCCGTAGGQEVTKVAEPDTGGGPSDTDPGLGYRSQLQELINLTEEQQEQITSINYALEDALFPIMLEAFQKYWELGRAFRAEPFDEAAVTTISADLERIEGRVDSVTREHRKMARALLNWQQLIVLGSLESALERHWAAQEAVHLNLIAQPEFFWPEDIFRPGDIFGPGGFIPFGGRVALFPERRNAAPGQPGSETTLDPVRLSQRLARLLAGRQIAEGAVK